MKTKILVGTFFLSAAVSLFSQLPQVVIEAPRIQFTENRAQLRELIPKLGDLQPDIGEENEVIKDTFEFRGHKFELSYSFQGGRLYAWNAIAHELSLDAAIGLTDVLVPVFEKRFGPATESVLLPGEGDGPALQASTTFSWKVNGFPLTLQMGFSPTKCRVFFGSQRLGGNGGDILRVTSTSVLKVEVVGHHGGWDEYRVEEDPSNETDVFVLLELARRGVFGTLSNDPLQPPDYGQQISASGGKDPKAKTYRLEGFRVNFPITIFRTLPNESKVAETHFGMGSLFPEGLELGGKKIDLKRYEDWRDDVPRRP
jgi:hypothetical protein